MTYPTDVPPVKIAPAPVYFPPPLALGDRIASWSPGTGWTGRAASRRSHLRGTRGGSRR